MLAPLQQLDLWLFDRLMLPHSSALDAAMSWISIAGTSAAIWLVLGTLAMLRPRHRAAAWRLYVTMLLCFVTVDLVLKPLAARPRPVALHAYDPMRELPPLPRTLSFPSGHTASAFGAAVALSRIWPQGRTAWWLMAMLMGYSRIYVGHHFPLDVAGGALVGILVALWVHGGQHAATSARGFAPPRGAVVRP